MEQDARGEFVIAPEEEDCHTAIENRLTAALGETGKKIHTARSRNDQVLTALRLFYKDRLDDCRTAAESLREAFRDLASRYGDVRFPGYTHTRKAMVSSVSLWADAFADSIEDDLKLLALAREWIDQSPLGTGAGYGVPLEVDRQFTAELLGFARVQQNPIYVQNSRGKFESLLVHALGHIMLDLNRMASDLILFSMPELGYFKLPEDFVTGSSIMPQKKNPDVLELIRGRTHGVLARGSEITQIALNLISGYHRDYQLTKKPVMEALDGAIETIVVAGRVVRNLEVDEKACKAGLTEEIFATERLYDLVRQGVPFREAYQRIAKQYE
jgi:argininosuccinate lyase